MLVTTTQPIEINPMERLFKQILRVASFRLASIQKDEKSSVLIIHLGRFF